MQKSTFQKISRMGALLALLVASQPGLTAPILSTTFDGRTVSGPTANNLTWVTNGIAEPGSLTASANLFDTLDTQDLFAVAFNFQNPAGGSWSVDVPLAVASASDLALGVVSLDAFIFNNSGAFQPRSRDLDLTLSLLAGLTVLDSEIVTNIYAPDGPAPTQPRGVSFDLSGNTLLAGNSYLLRLEATGVGPGNNAGIDNLVVNGTPHRPQAVSEPATTTLLALGLAGVLAARVRRRCPVPLARSQR